jgi:hypothetical protein
MHETVPYVSTVNIPVMCYNDSKLLESLLEKCMLESKIPAWVGSANVVPYSLCCV